MDEEEQTTTTIETNYERFNNLPVLNGITIIGDKKLEDYGLVPITSKELEEIQLEIFGYIL